MFVGEYTIKPREISDFSLYISGNLVENGEILDDKIKAVIDEMLFIDGIVPNYEVVYSKNGTVVNNVVEPGEYTATLVFEGNNYYTNKSVSFKVYGKETYTTLIIILVTVGVVGLLTAGTFVSIKVSRKRRAKDIQHEQLKRTKTIDKNKDENNKTTESENNSNKAEQ